MAKWQLISGQDFPKDHRMQVGGFVIIANHRVQITNSDLTSVGAKDLCSIDQQLPLGEALQINVDMEDCRGSV